MCVWVFVEVLVCLCVVKARQVFFGFQGSPEETTARPGCRREAWPACTALGQSGVRTRPFSPTLPVMDRRALFRMASEKDSYMRRDEREDRRRGGNSRVEISFEKKKTLS